MATKQGRMTADEYLGQHADHNVVVVHNDKGQHGWYCKDDFTLFWLDTVDDKGHIVIMGGLTSLAVMHP